MSKNSALKEDKKFVAVLIGGSLLISLVTILVGNLMSGTELTGIKEAGYAVEVLGWLWVAGTAGIAFMIQARMRQLYGTVRVTK